MKGYLSQNKIEYVLFHLQHHFDIPDEIREKMVFLKEGEGAMNYQNSIIFQLSANDINVKEVNGIHLLFYNSAYESISEVVNSNLIFRYDLLKSIFYLLSGYQEYADSRRDKLGRFSYHFSIQKEYGFILQPLVNYYFRIITDTINEWNKTQKVSIKSKPSVFKNFGFFLSHDVDRIDKYTLNYILYKIKELAGKVKSPLKPSQNFTELCKALYHWMNPFSKENPYWNFKFLLEIEKRLTINATYFFLHKGARHVDSSYSFSDKRLLKLYPLLMSVGHEIGIHGTSESITDSNIASSHLNELKELSGFPVSSCRQHRLLFEHPVSTRVQVEAGVAIDCTLGFFDYPGFRNSYCFPFRLYDFEKDQMTGLWEIPLTVMDCTLLDYCALNFDESKQIIKKLIDEIKKFEGIFSLLWHNNYFEEDLHPGITEFYIRLLEEITSFKPQSLHANEFINRFNNSGVIK